MYKESNIIDAIKLRFPIAPNIITTIVDTMYIPTSLHTPEGSS